MATLLLGIGLVLVIEGLVVALMPGRLEEIVRVLSEMPLQTRRTMGLIVLAMGVLLVYGAKLLGA